MKLLYWDGSGLVMAYKRLEEYTFTWPDIRVDLMTLGHAQFEALFAGLDWRRVRSVETRAPTAIEEVRHDDWAGKFRRGNDVRFDRLSVY